ncbi:MAG TPA: DUF2306 domain-containing protein [Bacteroidetes bacterium]|nr:DUF2306 domain-containing protein [Bacteroidota bacterium]
MSEDFIRKLIYAHAALGGVALLSGFISLIVIKGNTLHRITGKIFFYAMLSGASLGIIISVLPQHKNPFLFSIGIFSSYMILSGKRILALKKLFKGEKPALTEFFLPGIMIITGAGMLIYGCKMKMNDNNNGIVLIVFAAIGIMMSIRDFLMLRSKPADKKFWLYQHITKMTGGYIAAVTAFIVVNEILPGLFGWLTPTVVGTIYITYHQFRFRKSGEKILAERKIE